MKAGNDRNSTWLRAFHEHPGIPFFDTFHAIFYFHILSG